jgi:hypothetical protein
MLFARLHYQRLRATTIQLQAIARGNAVRQRIRQVRALTNLY